MNIIQGENRESYSLLEKLTRIAAKLTQLRKNNISITNCDL